MMTKEKVINNYLEHWFSSLRVGYGPSFVYYYDGKYLIFSHYSEEYASHPDAVIQWSTTLHNLNECWGINFSKQEIEDYFVSKIRIKNDKATMHK